MPRTRKPPDDPYQGWVTVAEVRNDAWRGQVIWSCKCGVTRGALTRPIGHEMARAHVAEHGVTVEVSAGPPARRVMGTHSSGVPTAELEESRAWYFGGAEQVAELRRRRRQAGGNVLARHLSRG